MIKKAHDRLRLQIRPLIVEARSTVDFSPMAHILVGWATPTNDAVRLRPTPLKPRSAFVGLGFEPRAMPLAIRPAQPASEG